MSNVKIYKSYQILILAFLSLVLLENHINCVSTQQRDDDAPKFSNDENEQYKKAYINQLKVKRQAHHDAIKRIIEYKDYKKQKELLDITVKTLFKTLLESLETLRKVKQNTDRLDEKIGNSLSALIENTAFCADIVLHFPIIFEKIYNKNSAWSKILESAITLTLRSELIDHQTSKAIDLMRQELNFVERDPNYVNPYKVNLNEQLHKQEAKLDDEEQEKPKNKKKKKEKRKRGPGLSGGSSKNEEL